jgi:hypothetical protein
MMLPFAKFLSWLMAMTAGGLFALALGSGKDLCVAVSFVDSFFAERNALPGHETV